MSAKFLQTAVLAAATLLFLIALPIVNCRRRNIFRIEQLDEDLGVKGYDHGKRENRMNQAMNTYPREKEKVFSVQDVCYMLSEALDKCRKGDTKKICQATDAKKYGQSIKNLSLMESCSCNPGFRGGNCDGCGLSSAIPFR
ncbi:PREDICTED: uncharacterized protein LOC107352266 [Acropora digitifera]|uniref:uncharacterized protein LOC107352266 n=1 Tax=Acropora digitifera TaxID=70779 RepID=UPI00077AEE0B|nr:PREDICTED: uncharacterized protein LOC107352266 [Acropora digitifera]